MTTAPVICFGQQPCGFFPRRYLFAKIQTALRLRSEIGGDVVFFCHDSDHDWRETRTILRHPISREPRAFNFAMANKIQKEFSPLYSKRVARDWQLKTAQTLPGYVSSGLATAFAETSADYVADFCLEMYRRMGLLEGVRVMRSSDPAFRSAACEIADYFVDLPYSGETVRARRIDGELKLHKGGGHFIAIPETPFTNAQISPARDTRLRWMQSVIRCTHYVAGASEMKYLNKEEAPEITYIERDSIENADEAYAQ